MEKLNEIEIERALAQLAEWKREEKFISRRYRFSTFVQGIDFVNRVAEVAERRNHHPFLAIDYKVVSVRLTSWHAGGLTMLDFDEALEFDQLYLEQSENA